MPTSPNTLAGLLLQQTKDVIYNGALSIATLLGLPVTSWQPGDPTRSLFYLESETLESLESIVVGYIASGFLDYTSGQWLAVLAKQVFNVDVPGATFAEADIVLTNSGGGVYDFAAGDLTVKNSSTGATYHSTTGGHLVGSGGTLTLHVVADVAGAASSAGATQIDTLVTAFLNVTCSNAIAAIGLDAQDDPTTRQQCRDKLGSLSPNGPAAAYSFVARNQALTGISTVTRARVYSDSARGYVTIYVAGAAGGVSPSDVTAVQNAVNQWSTPLCITPTVVLANDVIVPVTYTLWVYKSVNRTTAQIQADVLKALQALFSSRPIGGDITPPATTGLLYADLIKSTIERVYPGQTYRCTLTLPASDTALGNGDVPQLGAVTGTVNLISDP